MRAVKESEKGGRDREKERERGRGEVVNGREPERLTYQYSLVKRFSSRGFTSTNISSTRISQLHAHTHSYKCFHRCPSLCNKYLHSLPSMTNRFEWLSQLLKNAYYVAVKPPISQFQVKPFLQKKHCKSTLCSPPSLSLSIVQVHLQLFWKVNAGFTVVCSCNLIFGRRKGT